MLNGPKAGEILGVGEGVTTYKVSYEQQAGDEPWKELHDHSQ